MSAYCDNWEMEESEMIMEQLYNGHIHPRESIVPHDERYKELEEEKDRLFADLFSRVDETDKKQIEKIRDLMYESQSYLDEENFCYGLTMGMMLMQEGYGKYGQRYFRPER